MFSVKGIDMAHEIARSIHVSLQGESLKYGHLRGCMFVETADGLEDALNKVNIL